MATYLRFGTLTLAARKEVSAKRTDARRSRLLGHSRLTQRGERDPGIGGPEQAVGHQLPYRTRGQCRRVRQTRGSLGRRAE